MTEVQSGENVRENQLATIKEELKLGRNFYVEYDSKKDVIVIGNGMLELTLHKSHLDREDYVDVAKYSCGRLLEALDDNLLRMPVMGHA